MADGQSTSAVAVDELTKYVYGNAYTADAVDWANLYVQHIVQREGLFFVIISDRGQFNSN